MRLPFGRKNKTGEPPAVAEEVGPSDPAEDREAASRLPGLAGYYGTGRKKKNMPDVRFEYRRPDGKPVPPKHAERRRGGFFS